MSRHWLQGGMAFSPGVSLSKLGLRNAFSESRNWKRSRNGRHNRAQGEPGYFTI